MVGYEKNYLVQCGVCQFVFCKRKPTTYELNTHYNLYPRGNSISEITLKRYEELLDTFEPFRKTNNIIDVGCGDGFFLIVAKNRNWNVFGTEYTQEATEVCRRKGIEMTQSPLSPTLYQAGFFDVITSFEVIEHINTPRRELAAFEIILRQGGIVYVTTPNFNSISRDMAGSRWNIIEYPEHLCYYTKHSLEKLFREANFSLLNISTTGISLNRLKKHFYGSTLQSANSDEVVRMKIEQNLILGVLKRAVNVLLSFFGKGDAIKASFQKS